jgi:hypothetical protein
MAALLRVVARHPVLVFMVIGLGAGFLTAAIRPIADADVLPFDLPLHGFLGGRSASGLGAFLITRALSGRDGVVDLARRSRALARPGALVSDRTFHRSGRRDADRVRRRCRFRSRFGPDHR